MRWDQGLGATGLIVLSVVLTALVTIGVPITVSKDTVELKDWLGFSGNLLGAVGTLIAAYIAWRAVQRQIYVQQDAILLDLTTREEDRLEIELLGTVTILEICAGIADARAIYMDPREHAQTLRRFLGLAPSLPEMRALIRTRTSVSLPPALLERFSDLFFQLMVTVDNYAIFDDPQIAGPGWAPETAVEEARVAVRDMEQKIALAAADLEERRHLIAETLLPECRRRIEAGWSATQR